MTLMCFDGVTEISSLCDLLDYRSWSEGVSQENPGDLSPKTEKSYAFGYGN